MALAISYDRIPTMNKNTSPVVEKQYSMMTSDWRENFGMRERESMSNNEGSVKQYSWDGVSQAFPLIMHLDNFPFDNAL